MKDTEKDRTNKQNKSEILITPDIDILDMAMANKKAEKIRKWRKEFKKVDVSL